MPTPSARTRCPTLRGFLHLYKNIELQELTKVLRRILAVIRDKVPRCTGIHIFYAGPTGGAIILGQTINPRMNPPVHLYQYSQQTSPRYQHALTLTETLNL